MRFVTPPRRRFAAPVVARVNALAVLAPVLAGTLAACVAPVDTASSAPGAATCVDLGEQVVQLAWSQTGAFLGVGTVDADGTPWARSLRSDDPDRADGDARHVAGMLAESVVVGPSGELAWLSDMPGGRVLVEDGPGGRAVALPDGVSAIAWTAVGYALLQHPTGGGSRVLILDPDRPEDPGVKYETDLVVERLWISADPEQMLLTTSHPDHRDQPNGFEVVGSTASRHIEPPGTDLSGGSMPSLRRQVVYRSSETGRMLVVRVDAPDRPVELTDVATAFGRVSDRGVLAYVPVEPEGRLCLSDVSAVLRANDVPGS